MFMQSAQEKIKRFKQQHTRKSIKRYYFELRAWKINNADKEPGPMYLYWVTTEDHGEDWFIVANSPEEASTFYEDQEGYDPGDAAAEMIMEIPKGIKADIGWPSYEILNACGANIIVDGIARVVEIGGRRFCEGLMEPAIRTLDDDMSEAEGKGRPNKTRRSRLH